MKYFTSIILALFILVSCKSDKKNVTEQEDPLSKLSIAERIAHANGFDNWHKVNEIRYTFNVDRPENHFQRSWTWNPKTQDVTVTTEEGTTSYNRKNMDNPHVSKDQGFINDKYWLLAPFQLLWDKGTNITVQDSVDAPITHVPMSKLTIVYTDKGGYTPGDAYDLYFEDDYLIKEWVFRKGNVKEASMLTTWENYQDFNGLKLSTSHYSPDRSLQLYFTDIEVITD